MGPVKPLLAFFGLAAVTVAASIGFAIRGFFFPLQQILGIGGPATGIAVGGI